MVERAKLKQRLVGAAVLVALAVIVVPVVLNFGHEREWWGHRSSVPEPPQGFVTRVLPLEQWRQQAESNLASGTAALDHPAQSPAARIRSVPVAPSSPPPSKDVAPAPTAKTPVPPSATVSPAPTAPSASAPTTADEWVIQLGSFSSKKNADDLQAFLVKKGFRAFVEQGGQSSDKVYRVRIGPEKEREHADALRERVEHETQLRAIVLRYP